MRKRALWLLCACLCAPVGVQCAEAPLTPDPLPTAFIATPAPQDPAQSTRQPRGWYTVQGVSFDIEAMTVGERDDLINALRSANAEESVQDVPIVHGTSTTRDHPIYIGQRARFQQSILFQLRDGFVQEGTVSMGIREVVRGGEANDLVLSMNALNELPPPGKEYVVATFDIAITGEDTSELFRFSMYEFQPVSSAGRALDYAFLTDEMNLLQLYAGGEGSLRVTALVDEDTRVLLRYRDKIWFSTETPEE